MGVGMDNHLDASSIGITSYVDLAESRGAFSDFQKLWRDFYM